MIRLAYILKGWGKKCLLQAKTVVIMLLIALCSLPDVKAAGRDTVTIACDWDFAPYEYRSNKGENEGYCIEVLDNILNGLNIPHTFIMGSRQHAVDSFFYHKVDLIVDYGERFTGGAYCRSVSVLGYNHFMLARNRSSRPISRVDQIQGQNIAVNVINDSVPYDIFLRFADKSNMLAFNGREAMGNLEAGKLDYFLWGRDPLNWKIREFNLANVVVDSIDIEPKEIHIVGYDGQLMGDIDNQYARLQQSGKIDAIRDRWFHPELVSGHTSSRVWYMVLAVLLLALFILGLYRLMVIRVRKAMLNNKVTEAMMHQALSMGNFSVIVNNLRRHIVTNQHGHALPEEGISTQEMMERIHPDDREAMTLRRDVVRKLKGKPYPYRMRWNQGTKENPDWHTVTGFSYPEMGRLPVPKSVVIISRDITDELRQEQEASELTSRYVKMFESSLVAMSFYDKNGTLINLNENMKKLCGLDDEKLKYFWTTNLFDTETFKEAAGFAQSENMHTCTHMYIPSVGLDKYVEQRLRPMLDENGQLIFYAITARDVTDERNMYLEQQRQREALNDASKTNRRYERELRTLLENCNMYVWHTDLKKRSITFSRTLHGEEFYMSIEEYLESIDETQREEARQNMEAMLHSVAMAGTQSADLKPFNITHLFTRTPVSDTPTWFSVSGMPLPTADGSVKDLFGVVRNVSTLMEAQLRLREETLRAENSAMLKSTFLANMTHEIRTPLNAIVGFSDLLQAITDPAERKEFIGIIHNNCDMLMRLINDIFEASSLDIKPLAIVPRRMDFAREFNVVCQSLEQRVQEPGVKFIAESPASSFVTVIDMGRIQQVITNFVTNAVKYTHQGHIRVGWKPMTHPLPAGGGEAEGLYIFCEDTGTGIPKEKQARVFDRFFKLNDFVQGTGLGLAICKSIAQGCGGQIGLDSEGEGKGCTFWIWIPCKEIKTA